MDSYRSAEKSIERLYTGKNLSSFKGEGNPVKGGDHYCLVEGSFWSHPSQLIEQLLQVKESWYTSRGTGGGK